MSRRNVPLLLPALEKAPTGISGFDEISGGGLPRNRPTLVCGAAGCGKTLLAIEFLVRGALDYDEPGVFVSFEETEEELVRNVASLGFDLPRLCARKKLRTEHIRVDRSEIEETGEYDLEGLFIRLNDAIDSIGAKRVSLDTIEVLFSGLSNHAVVRSEIRRLFRWVKEKPVTAIVTGERGADSLTRYGLEEYVADCVVSLDHAVMDQISTRRLRIVKYRGSIHGTNVYPFLIGERGISVLPITSLMLDQKVTTARVPTGVPRLDDMLGGKGYYRGSAILISGSAGTGKTSLAAAFAASVAKQGGRCLYFAFEESPGQILRNMRSIGLHLEAQVEKGLLKFHAARPTTQGLESHLAQMHGLVEAFQPAAVVLDPITNLVAAGSVAEVKSMLSRLLDFLKGKQITTRNISLAAATGPEAVSDMALSSLMDTWLLLRNLETNGERNRCLYVLKSRGMAHSNQVREFVLSDKGIDLVDVYVGAGEVLTGSARVAQVEHERSQAAAYEQEMEAKQWQLRRKQAVAQAQIASLNAEVESAEEELRQIDAASAASSKLAEEGRQSMSRSRMGATLANSDGAFHDS
jgi:circadian clock protein KaiC